MRKGLKLFILISALLAVTGCWDRVEIEERGFVVGTALDQGEGDKLLLTFQFGVPSAMQGKADSKKQGGQPYVNVTTEAHTVFKAARQMSNVASRSPYLEHNRIILISERLARKGDLGDVLDLFVRDPETRRAAKIIVVEGEARKLLDVKTSIETLPVQYIDATAENPDKSESITPPTNIGQVHAFLLQNSSFALPKAAATKDKVSTNGAAVFNGYDHKLKGFLDEDETTGRNFITGTLKAGALEINVQGKYLVFEVKSVHRKLKADVTDSRRPVFDIDILVEGNIGESHLNTSLLGEGILTEAEKQTEAKIEALTADVIGKVQQEYKSDIFDLDKHLYQEHYKQWLTVKDNWDYGENYFSNCTIRVHPQVKVHVVGSVLKSE